MSWPKLPDGTVDWMTVFQHPKTGLTSLIDQADTSDKLCACFRYVIDTLFSRDSDEGIRQTYYKILDETFEGASDEKALGSQKTKIRMVMTRVMNDRIKLAREYVASQAGTGEDESRREEDANPEAVESNASEAEAATV
ncbi:MAG: hypothetical protein GKS00_28170 [Alphaproteobacteria bacterium]|nr:hypothetical protein [Alphaproteobacteria bacterium]